MLLTVSFVVSQSVKYIQSELSCRQPQGYKVWAYLMRRLRIRMTGNWESVGNQLT